MQVNNYPTLALYPAEDKSNPVCLLKQMENMLSYSSPHGDILFVALYSILQIKLSKKSSLKDMVRFIKEKLQISDAKIVPATDSIKDEL